LFFSSCLSFRLLVEVMAVSDDEKKADMAIPIIIIINSIKFFLVKKSPPYCLLYSIKAKNKVFGLIMWYNLLVKYIGGKNGKKF
jgi:hypothetical protein